MLRYRTLDYWMVVCGLLQSKTTGMQSRTTSPPVNPTSEVFKHYGFKEIHTEIGTGTANDLARAGVLAYANNLILVKIRKYYQTQGDFIETPYCDRRTC